MRRLVKRGIEELNNISESMFEIGVLWRAYVIVSLGFGDNQREMRKG